jgi:lycopene beta-cyclase
MISALPGPDRAPAHEFELLLVGGGLQNALIALAVLNARPDASVALLEASNRLGGNHTWSFHAGDVPERARPFVEPLVVHRWPGYDVAFPGLERRIAAPYSSISSERLATVVSERMRVAPNAALYTHARAAEVAASTVTLEDGRRFTGTVVIDARGPGRFEREFPGSRRRPGKQTGFQKFVGLELELSTSASRTVPLLMDARVPQTDGFRFFYVLPMSPRRVLVEDTYFSDSPDMDVTALREEILSYATRTGLVVTGVAREESGVLPLPLRAGPAPKSVSPLVAGYAGGWFHPATGYSFAPALRLALHVAETRADTLFGAEWTALTARHAKQFRFGALLNRMLFTAFRPEARWNALARFYRMPEEVMARFFALETTPGDRLRLLCGRPPAGFSLRTLRTIRTTPARGAFA